MVSIFLLQGIILTQGLNLNLLHCRCILYTFFMSEPPGKPIIKPSVQFSSVAQSSPTFCDPMDCHMPGLPVHHQLLGFIQTQVHWLGDATQPSHPLSSPSPPTFNLSGSFLMSRLFASGGQSIGASASASVHPVDIQVWFPLGLNGLISLLSEVLSGVFSSTTVKSINSLALSLLYVQLAHMYMTTGKLESGIKNLA